MAANTTQHNLLPSSAPNALSSNMDSDIKALFNLDRYLTDTLNLPYDFEDIKIKSNELCVSDNINASLYKIYYNFLYLNAQTKIASNIFPQNYRGFIASNSTSTSADVAWYNNSASTPSVSASSTVGTELLNTNGTVLSGLVDGVFIKGLGAETSTCGVVANSATLVAVRSNNTDTSVSVTLNTKNIEDATALSFNNIKSLTTDNEKDLFIVDDVTVYKMDIESLLTSNAAVSSVGRFLIKAIGGKSKNIYDKDKFNNPISVRTGKNDNIYVLDIGDYGYKVYDNNLNWLSTSSQKTNFVAMSGTVTDMAIDTSNGDAYVLSTGGHINKYNSANNLENTYKLDDTIEAGEQFKRIVFSKVDDNIVYILSNKNVYKKFKSKITRSIGVFRLSDNSIANERFTFIDVANLPGSLYDDVYVGGETVYPNVKSDIGKVFKFKEQVQYQTTVYDSYKTSAYGMSAIGINGEEYVSSWVINKAVHKLLYNHLILRDNMHGKFVGTYDNIGRVQYSNVNYITDTDTNLYSFSTTLDNSIGINEPVLAETVNRPLRELYDMQIDLLAMCKEKYTNKFPFATQVVTVP